jgi:hypothetical protein
LQGSLQELADDHGGNLEAGLLRLVETLRHAQHHVGKLTDYLQSKGIRVELWK